MRLSAWIIWISIIGFTALQWSSWFATPMVFGVKDSVQNTLKNDPKAAEDLAHALERIMSAGAKTGSTGQLPDLTGLKSRTARSVAQRVWQNPAQCASIIRAELRKLGPEDTEIARELVIIALKMQESDSGLADLAFEELQAGARKKLPPARSGAVYRLAWLPLLTRSAEFTSGGLERVLEVIRTETSAETRALMFAQALRDLPQESEVINGLKKRLGSKPRRNR